MNTHRYFPHTQEDIDIMLKRCGVDKAEDLYADVPAELLLEHKYNLPEEMSEKEVRDFFDALVAKNKTLTCFAGYGFYDHYAPAVIPSLISRSEYLTAYTPYQPEISQGTLQYIFEYQSMMATLTGLEVSNASMYDGATATAEAMMMAVAAGRKRNTVLVSATINPAVLDVVNTYARYHNVNIDLIPETADGTTDFAAMEAKLAADPKGIASVIAPALNRYGIIEDFTGVADKVHAIKALFIINAPASPLAVIKTPGEWGADVACGDAQSLGIPLNFGGPYLGYMCVTKALIRRIPGRIVGATKDAAGKRVFVLTLQAREQHIRREKATSNICSNQGLMALYVTIYMSLMGPEGLREVNNTGRDGAHYLASQLAATGKMSIKYPSSPFLNEFTMKCNFNVDLLIDKAAEAGILAGVKLADDEIVIAVTEMQSKADADRLVEIVKSL